MSDAAAVDPGAVAPLGERFGALYLAVDGSPCSDRAVRVALTLAAAAGATLTACHAYAAALHDQRFRQMEGGLPDPYRGEAALLRQRKVHDTLIDKGLGLIGDAYLDPVHEAAGEAGVSLERSSVEGRNWRVLLDDVARRAPDLVVLGVVGMGASSGIPVGSVCDRVVRRLDRDVLVVRDRDDAPFATLGVAVDGSDAALGALHAAIALSRETGGRLVLMSSFDPHFHYRVFKRISGVITEEAGQVFRLQDQERMHEEIIDDGLARIYKEHLDIACRIAEEAGVAFERVLLTGKAALCVRKFARHHGITTLFLGRTGIHSASDLDLGAVSELMLRTPDGPHLFLAARGVDARLYDRHQAPLSWTAEAEARFERVPAHVRGLASGAVERRARDLGHTMITSDLVDDVIASLRGGGGRPDTDERTLHWEAEALARLMRLPEAERAGLTRAVEGHARRRGFEAVTAALVDEVRERVQVEAEPSE